MNDVLNSQGYAQAAWWNRIPVMAWCLMAAIAVVGKYIELQDAYKSAKKAYSRATGNGKSPVKAVTSDKKVQKEMRQAAEALQEARERLQKPAKKRHPLRKLILLAIVGGVVALVVSEGARKAVLDALFGAEEEFEYTSTTSINGS